MVKTYQMHHGLFVLDYARIGGCCSFPDYLAPGPDQFEVCIDSRLRGKAKLNALIHEFMHAEHPTMPEEDVERTATNIASVLWGEGYREKQ